MSGPAMREFDLAAFLSVDDRKPVPVEVPEWGMVLLLRPLSAAQRDALFAWLLDNDKAGTSTVSARMLIAAACHADGSPAFREEHLPAIAGKAYAVLDRLANRINTMNGIGQEAAEAIAGNSGGDPSDGSSSASLAS